MALIFTYLFILFCIYVAIAAVAAMAAAEAFEPTLPVQTIPKAKDLGKLPLLAGW